MSEATPTAYPDCDVILLGAGIMSATLGVLLKLLEPGLTIQVYERLDRFAGESSDARNNAGTGHAALCELNYTPLGADGEVDARKALKVAEAFEVSKQFWAAMVEKGCFADPQYFLRSVPHLSFVRGEEDLRFLEKRYEALREHELFADLEFSADRELLQRWMPLVLEGRGEEPVAATRSELGTDVNFGELTRGLMQWLQAQEGVTVRLRHHAQALERELDQRWAVEVENLDTEDVQRVCAPFVFIGAGGAALHLLERSGLRECEGYGGFPVSGQWLLCKRPELAARHFGKVYGKARVGTPPMSVPHLDTRFLEGERCLLFGPFAGFSTRFLKEGSLLDMPLSFTVENLVPMLGAGLHNLPLTRYLLGQVVQSFDERVEALREYFPAARAEDWELAVAGQRVQVIKKDDEEYGRLEFGTEVVSAADNSLAALLGASPGASTSVSVALDVLLDCFPEKMQSRAWQDTLAALLPSWGHKLSAEDALLRRVRAWSHRVLLLHR